MQGPIPVTLPHTPGLDVAGTVDALGEGVDGVEVGDQVVGFLPMVGRRRGRGVRRRARPRLWRRRPPSIPLADAAALPLVGLTAWQALFDHAELDAGQRVLINGAGGAVGGYAVQLAKQAGAHVIATASPRSTRARQDGGRRRGHRPHRRDVTDAVTEPVDVAAQPRADRPGRSSTALVALVRAGGVVVNTTVWMPAPGDEERGVRGIDLFVRSDAEQLVAAGGAGRPRRAARRRRPSGCRWPSCRRSTPRPPRARCPARSSSSRPESRPAARHTRDGPVGIDIERTR